MIRLLFFLTFLFSVLSSFSQGQTTEMADTMRSEGKIYVVVAIILAILIGLFVYLFFLQRTIARLERRVREMTGEKEG